MNSHHRTPNYFFCMLACVCFAFLPSCGGNKKRETVPNSDEPRRQTLTASLSGNAESFACGDTVGVFCGFTDSALNGSIVQILIDGIPVFSGKAPLHWIWHTDTAGTGNHDIQVSVPAPGITEVRHLAIALNSGRAPDEYTYKVLKTYPHDPKSYTQGLIYREGVLFEGTGLYEHSKLRKEELSGKVLLETSLAPAYFGEGIAYFDNHIYQLTWKSGLGFIYDPSTFQVVRQFNYGTEGWGLTTDGAKLIMSDGSSNLYFFDKNFSFLDKVQVWDNKGPVEMLNELEYIDGFVYANVYQSNRIVAIDPKNGKVMSVINMEGLLSKEDYTDDTDVLNGIAWDAEGKRLFVTGKNWPRLFEIRLVKKTAMTKS